MSPTKKSIATSNIYTAMLALAIGAILATTIYVVISCYRDYGTIFTILNSSR